MATEIKQLLSVPVIDIGALLTQNDQTATETVFHEIRKACEEWGFFYAVNHGIDPEYMKKVTQIGMAFFNQPKEVKEAVARKPGNFQGYSESELTKQKVDWKQIFDYSVEEMHNSETPKFGIHGVNQWPQEIPQFRTTMIKYFQRMQALARTLMEAVLKTLSTESGLVEKLFADGMDTSFCRLNYYPICPTPETNLGVGPHSDAGILTVLYQDGHLSSLQVQKDGEFYNVPPISNSFVINIGDMTQVLSNSKYKAPVHRVLANHTHSRFSIPFFLNPSYSCVVEPLKESSQSSKYRPILWGDYRKGRVQGDYADVGEEIQIRHFEIE